MYFKCIEVGKSVFTQQMDMVITFCKIPYEHLIKLVVKCTTSRLYLWFLLSSPSQKSGCFSILPSTA